MPENIVEITRKMQDPGAVQKDCNDALELIGQLFQERYFDKIRSVVRTHQLDSQKNPPREIQLLNVLKQFAPESKTETFDQMIEMMMLLNTMNQIRSEVGYQAASLPSHDLEGVIHPDGIYDVDPNCVPASRSKMPNFSSMFMVMALSDYFTKRR